MKKNLLPLGIAAVVLALAAFFLMPQWQESRARAAADARLQAQPAYQVIAKHEPEVYSRVRDRYVLSLDGRTSADEFINFSNYELTTAATRRLAHASDDSANALLQDMIATARSLEKQPGDACFRYLFPQVSGPPEVARSIDAKTQAHTLGLLAEVIRSSAESPVPLPRTEDVQDKLAAVVNGVYETYGADAQMIAHAADPRSDRAKICTMTLSLYERILAWPPADSSALLRVMSRTE